LDEVLANVLEYKCDDSTSTLDAVLDEALNASPDPEPSPITGFKKDPLESEDLD
jgi:hypothetical protein